MPSSPRVRPGLAALAAILVAGLTLRLLGIRFGLPAIFNPDEVAIMNRAMAFATGDLNPHNFLYPTLYFYVLFAWEAAFFVVGRLVGVFDSLPAFERSFFVDPSLIYLAGRLLTAVLGVWTLVATWRLGARLFGQTAGVLAALLLAVAPLAVRDAHYVKHDVPVTLLIVLTHVGLAGLVVAPDRRRSPRPWLVVGLTAGLAMSTHYYAVFLIVPVAVVALATPAGGDSVWRRSRSAAIAGAACVAAFFAGSPFLLVEPGTAVRDIVANREIVMDRVTTTSGLFGSLGPYAWWLAWDAAGVLVCLLAIVGVAVAVVTDWRKLVLVSGFPVVFLLFISNTFPASRYLVPVLPFMAVLAGAALAWPARRSRAGRAIATLLTAAAVVDAGLASVRADLFFRKADTRALAADWIAGSLSPGASILVQPYSVVLRPSRASLVEALEHHLGSAERASIKFRRQLALDPYPAPAYRTIYLGEGGLDRDKIYVSPALVHSGSGLAPLHALGIEYVVLKRFERADPALAGIEAVLAQKGRRLATFDPYRVGITAQQRATVPPFVHGTDARLHPALERPGPTIEIWAIR
jgi:hypothetical protein